LPITFIVTSVLAAGFSVMQHLSSIEEKG